MLLYDSFIALNAETLTTTFQGIMIKRPDLALATKKAVASYRCLSDPYRISAYQAFLDCCEQALLAQNEASLLDVMISFLAESEELNERDACEKLTRLFNLCFEHQHDALSIASMGLCFVDRPRALVSFIRYLLQHAVTPERILSTHLLHNYFRYYLSSLSQPDNSIKKLYQLFGLFEEVTPLIAMATQLCCGERGFDAYALDGRMQDHTDELTQVELVHSPIRFTVDDTNLKTLHAVFHEDFLIEALCQWSAHAHSVVWVNTITHLFNQPDIVLEQLPLVISRLYDHPLLWQALARILNEQSLSILVEKHVVGLLSLTPFCPRLLDMIQTYDLPLYLQSLKQQHTSGPALFFSLFSLFNYTKHSHVEFSLLIFDALLDAIDLDPSVLEDTIMIGKLRKFPPVNAWVNKRVRAFEDEFETILQSQTQASIDEMDYISIYDAWSDLPVKIRHLKELVDLKTTFPMDKYMLYVQVAKAFIRQESCAFDLPVFSRALKIEPVFDTENITLYERMLVELLAMIDDEKLRANCIQILDENARRSWLSMNYGGQCLFTKAVRAGNLGLIQWIEKQELRHPYYSFDSLAKIAAYDHHWPLVSYFHVHHALKQGTVNMLFEMAVFEGRLLVIPALWDGEYPMPDMAVIEKAFQLSVEKNDVDNIRCLIASPKIMCEKVIKKSFHAALDRKYFDIVIALAEGYSGKMMQGMIEQALRNAARLNQCDVLDALQTLVINRPTQCVIENAFIAAARAGHLSAIKCLVGFSTTSPSMHVISLARDEARNKNRMDIDDYLLGVYNQVGRERGALNHSASSSAMSLLQQQSFFRIKSDERRPASAAVELSACLK